MINADNNKFLSVMRKVFESYLLVPVIFCYAFFCWYFANSMLTVVGFALVFTLVLVFAKNVNNIFPILIYVSFFIKDIGNANTPWTVYIVSIGVAVIGLISFIVKTLIIKKGELKKGKMFPAIIVSAVAFLLGGIVGRFNILNTAIIFAFSVVTFIIYFIANNCTKNLGKYLAYMFVLGALFITAEICVTKIRNGDLFDGYPIGEVFFFSAQELNTASIYIMLGIVGLFYLGLRKKYDVVCFLFTPVFCFGIFLSCCRTVLAVSIFVMIAIFVLFIIYSPRRWNFLWLGILMIAGAVAVYLCFTAYIVEFIDMLIQKLSRGLNGRDQLWPWCLEKFMEYPIFGYGFVADETIPSLRSLTTIILAHNTLLQWLTSLGVVGISLMSYFYIVKYKTLFNGVNAERYFYIIAVIAIELTGMFDQAAAMDTFTYLVPFVLMGGLENSNSQPTAKELAVDNDEKEIDQPVAEDNSSLAE